MTILHDDAKLIEALGGTTILARKFGYSQQRINNWRYRGIAPRVLLNNTRLWARARRLVNGKSEAVVFDND